MLSNFLVAAAGSGRSLEVLSVATEAASQALSFTRSVSAIKAHDNNGTNARLGETNGLRISTATRTVERGCRVDGRNANEDKAYAQAPFEVTCVRVEEAANAAFSPLLVAYAKNAAIIIRPSNAVEKGVEDGGEGIRHTA